MIVVILSILAIVYLVFISHRDHMTNKDVKAKQDFHDSKPSGWKPKHPVKVDGQAIYGPTAPKLDPHAPEPGSGGGGKNGSGVYPDIYGPESITAPGQGGTLPGQGEGGDSSNPPPYDYVPAAEFPAGPLQPEPYLNDFSKILKM
jgi:hypothetical protein